MNMVTCASRTIRLVVALGTVAVGAACGPEGSDTDKQACNQADGCPGTTDQPEGLRDPFAPFVVGDNSCCLIQAYFPKELLGSLLPERLTIPDDATMAALYPDTELKPDAHPFLLSFCHGSNIHDVWTNKNVPEQEEIMFLFPVVYTRENGERHLCSYVPVLYLDSYLGVMGGLYYGLRKEYHPEMKHAVTDATRWWYVKDVVDASFAVQPDAALERLPAFVEQTYSNPFVTLSYPLPLAKMVFYQAGVFPSAVRPAQETFTWNYKGTTVTQGADTWSVTSDYHFTMSQPMNAAKYFQ